MGIYHRGPVFLFLANINLETPRKFKKKSMAQKKHFTTYFGEHKGRDGIFFLNLKFLRLVVCRVPAFRGKLRNVYAPKQPSG